MLLLCSHLYRLNSLASIYIIFLFFSFVKFYLFIFNEVMHSHVNLQTYKMVHPASGLPLSVPEAINGSPFFCPLLEAVYTLQVCSLKIIIIKRSGEKLLLTSRLPLQLMLYPTLPHTVKSAVGQACVLVGNPRKSFLRL